MTTLISGFLMTLTACARMPEGELVSVEYSRQGTMMGYEYFGRLERDSTGAYVLRAMKKSRSPLYEKHLDDVMVANFRKIIEEEKMYKYKERYLPHVRVHDGWTWGFKVVFSDGTEIYSHGNNAKPSGDGLNRIRSYMEELAQSGTELDSADVQLDY